MLSARGLLPFKGQCAVPARHGTEMRKGKGLLLAIYVCGHKRIYYGFCGGPHAPLKQNFCRGAVHRTFVSAVFGPGPHPAVGPSLGSRRPTNHTLTHPVQAIDTVEATNLEATSSGKSMLPFVIAMALVQ